MPVVVIRGIPGSGKSWLVKKLNALGAAAFDTDEIIASEFRRFSRTPLFHRLCRKGRACLSSEPPWHAELHRRAAVALERLTAAAIRSKTKTVIVCGIALKTNASPGLRFFIKIPARERPAFYRRVIVRNLAAVRAATATALTAVKKAPVDEIAALLEMSVGVASGEGVSYGAFVDHYHKCRGHEEKLGAKVLPQKEILHQVLALTKTQ